MSKYRIRTNILSIVAGLVLLGASGVPALAHSIIGEGLEAAEQTDFYQFFHFKEADKQTMSPSQTAVSFSTGMQGFNVQWMVVLDKNQQITSSVLLMPRDFVESPQWGLFARDIAKSFLLSTIPNADRNQIVPLTHEISYAGLDGSDNLKVTVITSGSIPSLPSTPSKGYLTFQGKQQVDEEAFSKSTLKIENSQVKGKPMISFAIAKTGP